MRPIALALGLTLPLIPGAASAQSKFLVNPSFSISTVYDDNLFAARSDPQADHIWRLSPRFSMGRRSRELTVHAEYGLDAEIYRRHPELNSVAASQEAALDIQWRPARSLAAAATASYVRAPTAGTLNTITGLQIGRVDARRLSSTESLVRRFGGRTEAKLEHAFTLEQFEGIPDVTTQSLGLGLERRRKGQGRARVRYRVSQYVGVATTLSQVATLGLSAAFTRFAQLDIDVGPRRTGPAITPEASVALSRRFRKGWTQVGYLHTQTTVVGYPAPVTADGVTATLRRDLGRISVTAAPSFFHVRSQGLVTTLPRVGVDLAWHFTRDLALSVSQQLSLQRGSLIPAEVGTDITHNTLLVGLVARPATR